jgi:hypothetical protein
MGVLSFSHEFVISFSEQQLNILEKQLNDLNNPYVVALVLSLLHLKIEGEVFLHFCPLVCDRLIKLIESDSTEVPVFLVARFVADMLTAQREVAKSVSDQASWQSLEKRVATLFVNIVGKIKQSSALSSDDFVYPLFSSANNQETQGSVLDLFEVFGNKLISDIAQGKPNFRAISVFIEAGYVAGFKHPYNLPLAANVRQKLTGALDAYIKELPTKDFITNIVLYRNYDIGNPGQLWVDRFEKLAEETKTAATVELNLELFKVFFEEDEDPKKFASPSCLNLMRADFEFAKKLASLPLVQEVSQSIKTLMGM